jgi:hypothetical protein
MLFLDSTPNIAPPLAASARENLKSKELRDVVGFTTIAATLGIARPDVDSRR